MKELKRPGGAKKMWDDIKKKYVSKKKVKKQNKFLSKSSLIIKGRTILGKKSDGPYHRPRIEDYDFTEMKVSELKALAKERELKNYSDLKKSELIELVKSSFKK